MDAKHDVLVIGAGCAGMRAAIAAHDAGADVAVVSKLHPTRSHSGAAEGGINAALGNAADDSPETHAFDTVKGSDYLGDQDAIEIFTAEAPGDIYQLEHWGAVFSRAADGRLAQRPFGAAGSPRTVFAADITGHVLIQVLYERLVKRDIKVYEEYFAWQLDVDDGRCQGVLAWDLLHGGLKAVGAKLITERLPGSRGLAMTFAGVDPINEPVPVRPGAHYHMGGVETGTEGETELTGLYAAGEVACVSVHGANRLGGNSLMETITFGRRAGQAAAEWALTHTTITAGESILADAGRELKTLLDRDQGERPWQIRDDLGASMLENFGVFHH